MRTLITASVILVIAAAMYIYFKKNKTAVAEKVTEKVTEKATDSVFTKIQNIISDAYQSAAVTSPTADEKKAPPVPPRASRFSTANSNLIS